MSTPSNYPPGVTTSDLPGWRSYPKPEGSVDCDECGDYDLLGYQQLTRMGRTVCPRCCPSCDVCGEWMTDDNRFKFGKETNYAGSKGHASCVAQQVIEEMAGESEEYLTREQIAEMFEVVTR